MKTIWKVAPQIEANLISNGWRTPDTYSKEFLALPNSSGIYLITAYNQKDYAQAFVAYVGISKSLSQRLKEHPICNEVYKIGYWPIRWFKSENLYDLRNIEREYIKLFDPPWNSHGRRPSAEYFQ